MLGKTSVSAIRTLILLAEQQAPTCRSPRRLAQALGESPTYLAKVVRHMVKARILEAEKGVKGGVRLLLPPEEITLLAVVEACQGTIAGDYCRSERPASSWCGFHRAASELHETVTGVLRRWTIHDLLDRPPSAGECAGGVACVIYGACPSAEPLREVRP